MLRMKERPSIGAFFRSSVQATQREVNFLARPREALGDQPFEGAAAFIDEQEPAHRLAGAVVDLLPQTRHRQVGCAQRRRHGTHGCKRSNNRDLFRSENPHWSHPSLSDWPRTPVERALIARFPRRLPRTSPRPLRFLSHPAFQRRAHPHATLQIGPQSGEKQQFNQQVQLGGPDPPAGIGSFTENH